MMKSKRWMITFWDFNEFSFLLGRAKDHLFNYYVIGKEICPVTQKLHYHGYFEFLKEYTLSSVKSIFKSRTMHCEIARLGRKPCVTYCLKDNDKQLEYTRKQDEDEEDVFEVFGIPRN